MKLGKKALISLGIAFAVFLYIGFFWIAPIRASITNGWDAWFVVLLTHIVFGVVEFVFLFLHLIPRETLIAWWKKHIADMFPEDDGK
jgi:hypothetical protein